MKIAVVIVNFNSDQLLEQCLEHVTKQSRPADVVMVVDNASEDGSAKVAAHTAGVRLLQLDKNYGFAAANNRAFEQLENIDLVVTLNPDAYAAIDFIANLEAAAIANPNHGSFASRMMRSETVLDGTGDSYHLSGLAWRRGHNTPWSANRPNKPSCFSACAGAAMFRLNKVRAVGGFDEDFFCYMEDIDLGYRLLLVGAPCLYVGEAVATHIGSAISNQYAGFADYHGHRNLVWVVLKNTPWPLLPLVLPAHLLMTIVVGFVFLYRGSLRNYLRAKYDALTGLGAALKKRRSVQRLKKVSAWRVCSAFHFGLWR